jgi:hypothetical protein
VAVFTASAVGPGADLGPFLIGCAGLFPGRPGGRFTASAVWDRTRVRLPFPGCVGTQTPTQGTNARPLGTRAPGGSSWNGQTGSLGLWANGCCGVRRFHQGRDRHLHGTGRSIFRAPRSPSIRPTAFDCQILSRKCRHSGAASSLGRLPSHCFAAAEPVTRQGCLDTKQRIVSGPPKNPVSWRLRTAP